MPIVEPHLYADTPLFREMLYEREGRFPGTPEGEEDLPEVQLCVSEPMPEDTQVVPVITLQKAMYRVRPIGPDEPVPVSFTKD
jgi:hypothetical protein